MFSQLSLPYLCILLVGSTGFPQGNVRIDDVYRAYAPSGGQFAIQDQGDFNPPPSRLVANKNGQLVRAYPASALKKLRLVPVSQVQASGTQGQAYYALQSPTQRVPVTVKVQPTYIPQHQPLGQYVNQPPAGRPKPKSKPIQHLNIQDKEEELEEEYPSDPNPQYNFSFDVKDDELTNYQNRQEERDGGVIKGSYSVVDPDGYVRTVTYTADSKNGFQAKVVREPTDVKIKFPVPTSPPDDQQLKPKSRPPKFQYASPSTGNAYAPQVYTEGTHLAPTYVLRRVPPSRVVPDDRFYKVVRAQV